MKRQGILPEQLIIRNMDEIKIIFKDNEKYLDKKIWEKRNQHYEKKRIENLKICLKVIINIRI